MPASWQHGDVVTQPTSRRFVDRVVLVTGAGSGIGAECARAFAGEGAAVAVVDIDASAAARTVAEIEAQGGQGVAIVVDLVDPAAPGEMVAQALARFGRVDVLHGNAGHGTFARVAEVALADWERVFALNLTAAFLGAKAVLPAMIARGGGTIVHTASVAGLVAEPGLAAYCAAKAGLISLTRSIAVEYARQGVRCNCVCPGTIDTPSIARMRPDLRERLERAHPIGRLGTVEEIARLVLFLASSEASFVTGATFLADGGAMADRGVTLI